MHHLCLMELCDRNNGDQQEGIFKHGFEWANSCCHSLMKAQMIYSHIKCNIIPPPLNSTTLFIYIIVLSHSCRGRKKTNRDVLFRGKRRLSWLKCLCLFPPISQSQLCSIYIINWFLVPRRIIDTDVILLTPCSSLHQNFNKYCTLSWTVYSSQGKTSSCEVCFPIGIEIESWKILMSTQWQVITYV